MKLTAGKEAPEVVNAFIEIPMGSSIKYEYDLENDVLKVDRFLYTSMAYPANYGFIPGTLGKDGDPLDIMVMSDIPLQPGSYIEVVPIGVLRMEDEEGIDNKIIAVPKAKVNPFFAGIKDTTHLPEPFRNKVTHFFDHYKELEPNKWIKTKGWLGAEDAKKMIKESMKKKRK
ncbi:MAG TPA: inorganic diphosphatase [Candidatus Baltobacteraceae bacterium]|nr:inorganic diphosphatase [Candidatus Baltobacteraceae bacterium]